ncbi:MAG TPA: thioredoxin family protein [Fimbriimonas sp.]|nr:thioredoxin family protein [Fimbriimonas sp.]
MVSRDEWIQARKEFLTREKEFTKARDALSAARRELPWTKIENYEMEGAHGKVHLSDLFKSKSQLVVYHFMLGPGWSEGCPSCSFWADNFNGIDVHLAHRDTSFVAISRAPYAEIVPFKERMGWNFDWYSSNDSRFNFDLGVSFDEPADGKVNYNFRDEDYEIEELPGISAFAMGEDGSIYRTYSTYARGLDLMNGAYNYLDLTPMGRHEEGLSHPMAWVRHHDRYDE